jgi:hypothetical protein
MLVSVVFTRLLREPSLKFVPVETIRYSAEASVDAALEALGEKATCDMCDAFPSNVIAFVQPKRN